MATNNAVNTTLSGQSGSGSFAGTTSPTFITPVLGASTATSINFGGSTLSSYASLTNFTPTFTFATPGDLSVAYAIQTGKYSNIGGMIIFSYTIRFTPTFTTSSGNAQFLGLPFDPSAINWTIAADVESNVTWPVGTTQVMAELTLSTGFILVGRGSATAGAVFSTTNFLTGVQYTVVVSGSYAV